MWVILLVSLPFSYSLVSVLWSLKFLIFSLTCTSIKVIETNIKQCNVSMSSSGVPYLFAYCMSARERRSLILIYASILKAAQFFTVWLFWYRLGPSVSITSFCNYMHNISKTILGILFSLLQGWKRKKDFYLQFRIGMNYDLNTVQVNFL